MIRSNHMSSRARAKKSDPMVGSGWVLGEKEQFFLSESNRPDAINDQWPSSTPHGNRAALEHATWFWAFVGLCATWFWAFVGLCDSIAPRSTGRRVSSRLPSRRDAHPPQSAPPLVVSSTHGLASQQPPGFQKLSQRRAPPWLRKARLRRSRR